MKAHETNESKTTKAGNEIKILEKPANNNMNETATKPLPNSFPLPSESSSGAPLGSGGKVMVCRRLPTTFDLIKGI